MKTKILSLLAIAGLLFFTGCASEDTANKQTEQEPSTEGLTGFVEEVPATRTTAEYDGSGLNFYWTAGDRIWVNNGGTLTQDAYNNISSKLENNPANPSAVQRATKAKFWFNGTFTASSYPVRYTGKNGTKDKVTIKASQTQTIPNDASHIGEDGDFGVATATKPAGVAQYHFALDHKAAYITFMPYTDQGVVAGAKLQKIRVFTGNPSDALAGTFDLADDGTLSNPASTSNSVELTVPNFSIPSTSTYTTNGPTMVVKPIIEPYATNGATMVVNPGTYNNVSIEYTVHDPVTNVTGTITKTYPSVTFMAGRNKKVNTDLQVPVYYQDSYYMWDAAEGQDYWCGHLDSDGKPDGNYPLNNTDPRWHREDASLPCPPANRSAKDCPNVNELIWYAKHGEPHWDNTTLWATMGHLYTGGMWLKKKDKISGFTDINYYGTDYRLATDTNFPNPNITQGKPSNISDYFYLPALGWYQNGTLYSVGEIGYYWSSSPSTSVTKNLSWYLTFVKGLIITAGGPSERYRGFLLLDKNYEDQYRPFGL